MATFIQALMNHQLGDDPALDRTLFHACLIMYDRTEMTAAEIKTAMNLTTPQGAELDEILATRPNILAALLTRSQWPNWVYSVVTIGSLEAGVSGYATPAQCRTKLGLSN